MKKLIALAVLMVLANCEIKPRTAQAESSNDYNNNKTIIAREGFCTLYKVDDGLHYVYWSICTGGNNNSAVHSY